MDDKHFISQERFLKRLGDLCLRSGLAGFPKDEADQHILLKSAVLVIGPAEGLSEAEINARLKQWCAFTGAQGIDHGTLRRRLVDTGYLTRSSDGSAYSVRPDGAGAYEFEPGIDRVDVAQALASAREEIERRKQFFLAKNRKE
jgi:hypothetical protein